MWATAIVGVMCLLLTQYIARIAYVPYKYYFPILVAIMIWVCMQYTGGWEDFAIFVFCSVLGLACKKYKFSRPALLIGFILAPRIEALTYQITALYDINTLITRPIFLVIMTATIGVFVWGAFRKNRINYS
jgi:TctA family transporter